MRITYDATPLLMRSAGVKNYHHALLRRLIPSIWPHELKLFPFLGELTPNENLRSNYPPWGTKLRLAGVLASNYLHLPTPAWGSRGADVFHLTHHLFHPPGRPILTSMVHDPTPLTMPECHTVSNIRYFERFVRHTLPRLEGLITPSHAVKRDLISQFGAEEHRITVVHHGVDEDFFEASPASRQVARRTYKLPDRYVLSVGSIEPRKNLARLAHAYAGLPEKLQKEAPLLIVGDAGWKNEAIRQALESSRHIRTIGYVRRELLPAVYSEASVFVFPSLYEGFGMPLLEAMAAGAPVVTSNVSAMPEVVGDCGLKVDPYDVDALSEALRSVLEDPQTATLMGAQARQRAHRFTWDRCAEETKSFFEAVSGLV